ncbi:UDP-N-acetylmuramate--L-alanine ligase [Cellulomonas sp. PhB143]|uniref:UDP-N-acetylmuramate--L-alanine ligase n=1 Tax=Cellulomonas sp. PhB143 TaxID=2485186 RepID=UPI001F21FD10|nr:UDP-N-acetylmuramate--L-alanine ligase [Cellulomonas sp. PhB143]
MSVVARLLAAQGIAVQGSDARGGPALDALRADGVTVWVGHDGAHVAGADTLVVSSAVRADNPEVVAAHARGLRVLHRSQALAALMRGRRSVAVAGAHGKTTTSGMLATLLAGVGLDPSFAIGGTVITPDGPVAGGHLGSGDVLVAEADESDGSFLNYAPDVAVVTNVEPDHLDHYGSREAFERAFVDFAARVRPGGTLVACGDDEGARALAHVHRATGGTVLTYGRSAEDDLRLDRVEEGSRARARLTLSRGPAGTPVSAQLRLRVPGVHNLLDAAGAVGAALALGVGLDDAVAAVGEFRGTGRRFEARGEAGGVRVVDDYAHHPTEVAALLTAARDVAGEGRVVVLFQPHLYSRTRTFGPEFARALALADQVVVTGVYAAREAPDPGVDASTIVQHMDPGTARAVEDRFAAAAAVADAARPGDLVLTVGAGDVTELGPRILARLERADREG